MNAATIPVDDQGKPGLIKLFKCKCPRCRRGDMFVVRNPYDLKNFMKMNKTCAVCAQPFDIEPGFYYGTSFVSYALTVAVSVASFIAWWVLVGFSLHDNRVFYWMIVNALILVGLQPVFMRLSRTIWLAFFVRYDRDWKNPPREAERINPSHMDSW